MDWLTSTKYAHRGLHDISKGIPENSQASFAAAADAGYGIELDVRLSADGQAVVFHDATLDAKTNLRGPIAARTADELAQARLCGTPETLPRLSEVLDLVGGRVPILIEIKSHREPLGPLEKATRELIGPYSGAVGILSFNPRSVRWFRDHAPQIPRGLTIIGLNPSVGGTPLWRRLIMRTNAALISCTPDFYAYDLAALTTRKRPLPVIAWTVRTDQDRQRAEKLADSYMFEGLLP